MKRKTVMLACAVAVVAILAVAAAVLFALNRNAPLPSESPRPVALSGNLSCLKHKNAGPDGAVTLECAIGLRTKDQRYYALQDLPQEASMTEFDKTIEINGELSQPGPNEKYDIAGTIKVTSYTVK